MDLSIEWTHPPRLAIAGGYGYSVANTEMYGALQGAGVIFSPDADIAVHFTSPALLERVPGKYNVAFTMFESVRLPKEVTQGLRHADALIVPSRFCVDIFRPYFSGPIYRCPLGIHPDKFPYYKREWSKYSSQPFRWHHVGAPSFHKGTDCIDYVWSQAAAGATNCELYLKTTGNIEKLRRVAPALGFKEWQKDIWINGNVIFDGRNVSVDELRLLYNEAHGFLFPTGGEGWGLTLMEALSTGLPSIATNYSGHLDYANHDNCYLVDWHPVEAKTEKGLVVDSAFANPRDVARAMFDIMSNYRKAVRVGKRASKDMKRFTWKRAGEKLAQILEEIAVKRAA